MYKFSFKIQHRGCFETELSKRFPKHHITVVDIQSRNPNEKQYFYYINGDEKQFEGIIEYLKKTGAYKTIKDVERSKDTLLLVVILHQKGFVQNIIQKYHGFFIDLHTVHGGFEYWHVGVVDRDTIRPMMNELKKAGKLSVVSIAKVDFAHTLLSPQQKKIFQYAHEQGYYHLPRKTTILQLAHGLKLSPATVGEHLLRAENKLINRAAQQL